MRVSGGGFVACVVGQNPFYGSCRHGNKSPVCIAGDKVLDQL